MAYSKISKDFSLYIYWKVERVDNKYAQRLYMVDADGKEEFVTFHKIKKDISKCVREVSEKFDLKMIAQAELGTHMQAFVKDVEKDPNYRWDYSDKKIPKWCLMEIGKHHDRDSNCSLLKTKGIQGRESCKDCEYLKPMNKFDFMNQ